MSQITITLLHHTPLEVCSTRYALAGVALIRVIAVGRKIENLSIAWGIL